MREGPDVRAGVALVVAAAVGAAVVVAVATGLLSVSDKMLKVCLISDAFFRRNTFLRISEAVMRNFVPRKFTQVIVQVVYSSKQFIASASGVAGLSDVNSMFAVDNDEFRFNFTLTSNFKQHRVTYTF